MPQRQPDPSEVPVSEELFAPVSPGVELCYQTFGDPGDEPLLLVMGLGGPMTWWDPELCRMLVDRGFFVVRFDNRDCGRSTRIPVRVRRSQLLSGYAALGGRPAYTLADMAADAFGLLDHLGLARAHLVGVSMGGMIAQTMAVERPPRIRSLVSIMSTTGKRSVGWAHPRLLPLLFAGRGSTREEYVRSSPQVWRRIGSPAYPQSEERMRERAEETWDRGYSVGGLLRQMLAVLDQPNRSPRLRGLRIPATVIHGSLDPMVHVSGGRATAAAIPDAELLVIDGMGHDLPPALFETFADAIRRTAARAGGFV